MAEIMCRTEVREHVYESFFDFRFVYTLDTYPVYQTPRHFETLLDPAIFVMDLTVLPAHLNGFGICT